MSLKENFEDTKGEIRSRNTTEGRQYNGQKIKYYTEKND
jgi:hypothetical protein